MRSTQEILNALTTNMQDEMFDGALVSSIDGGSRRRLELEDGTVCTIAVYISLTPPSRPKHGRVMTPDLSSRHAGRDVENVPGLLCASSTRMACACARRTCPCHQSIGGAPSERYRARTGAG